MSDLDFSFPSTRIIFGANTINRLPELIASFGARRVFVVTDPGVAKAGITEKIGSIVCKSGATLTLYQEVEENPSVACVTKGAEQARQFAPDMLVAVGGGSSIDTTKGIGILLACGGSITDYNGPNKVTRDLLPVIAVPTTAGTGSEVSPAAVITDISQVKFSVRSPRIEPKIAILDPALLGSLPASIAASTGMDAFCHNLEYYLSLAASPMSEAVNLQGIRLVGRGLRPFVKNRKDLEAAGMMSLASMMGEISFSLLRLGVNHAISHPLGGHCHLPHGLACAITLPHSLRYNLPACMEKLRTVAECLGEKTDGLSNQEAANKAIEVIERLSADIGIPRRLSEVGVKQEMIKQLAADTMLSGQLKVNPRPVALDDVIGILQAAF
jgi:alcohol dehydrogenase